MMSHTYPDLAYAPDDTSRGTIPAAMAARASRWAGTVRIAVVAILFIALFRHNLQRLWERTNPFSGDPNWGHSVFVPFIGLFYLYLHRAAVRGVPVRPSWSGLPILLAGIALYMIAVWPGQNEYLQDIGMVLALAGAVVMACGWRVMRVSWFAVLFLICAIPWPETFYNWVCTPLQRLAARAAVATLSATGVAASQIGTKIYIQETASQLRVLNVAEACSGLRAIGTFITVAAVVAFLNRRPPWQKVLITLSSIPIAVICNVARVAGQGLLDHYVGPRVTEGPFHEFGGGVMFFAGFLLIIAVAWILDHIFIREDSATQGATLSQGIVQAPVDPAPVDRQQSASLANRPHTWRMSASYVALVAVLAISTAGLGAATHLLRLTFAKLPVELTKPLDTLPARLAVWQQIGPDTVLDPAVEETLGTRQYAMRNYLDTRQVDAAMLHRLQTAPQPEQDILLSKLRAIRPAAVVNLALTYYTGTVEKLSHMPEVCYVADGYRPAEGEVVRWKVGNRQLDMRFLQFEDQSIALRANCNVAYIFHVNGVYDSDAWHVRVKLQSPFVRHNYFAKVELMMVGPDREQSAAVMQDFLTRALPEIEACLPDWATVSRGDERR